MSGENRYFTQDEVNESFVRHWALAHKTPVTTTPRFHMGEGNGRFIVDVDGLPLYDRDQLLKQLQRNLNGHTVGVIASQLSCEDLASLCKAGIAVFDDQETALNSLFASRGE